jgi:hypothetical protein
MSQRHYIVLAGPTTVEVTDRVPLEGWELTEKAEEGSVGSGTMWLADPDMDLDIDGLRAYYVLEDASEATDNVLFGGFAIDPELSRGEQGGMFYDPVARNWQIQLTDRNGFWNRRVMTGADCKRPAETDVARIQWLFASAEADWVEDDTTYVSTASASNMDKVDYRGQLFNQVVDDCAQASTVGKNWWVQLQETGTGRQDVVWYGKDGLTAYQSDLYLSNDPDDWDDSALLAGTSLVWPIGDATRLRRDTSRVYTGVYLRYGGSSKAIYRKNAASVAVYGRRDHIADYPNVKTKTKAIVRATRLLNDLADPDERIMTTVELPAAKATMLRAGMRVRFKATHLEGYGDQFYNCRVLECMVSPVAAGTRYRLSLVLQGPGAAAGNGPYTGSAYGALLELTDYGTPDLFLFTGDDTPLSTGWINEPNVGPITVSLGATLATQTITCDEEMIVRIQARVNKNMVYQDSGSATMSVVSSVAGVIGYVTHAESLAGFNLLSGDTMFVELRNYAAVAGEVFTITLTTAGIVTGGWYTIANNGDPDYDPPEGGTFLRVGRGTQSWNSGNNIWEGP